MPRHALAAVLVLVCARDVHAQDADAHLTLGAAHFRAGRFTEAVVEFRVARARGGGGDTLWYIASALTRAGRATDAVEAFREAAEVAPKSADALLLYYRGVACSDAELLVCANDAFEQAARTAGPKVAEQARRLAAEARAVLGKGVPPAAIALLTERAAEAAKAGRPRLAAAINEEVKALRELGADAGGGVRP